MGRTKVRVYRKGNILVRVRKLRDGVFAYELLYMNAYNRLPTQVVLIPKKSARAVLNKLSDDDYQTILELTGQGGIDEYGRIYFLPQFYTKSHVNRIKKILQKYMKQRQKRGGKKR